jgi:archaellum biogenesis protein FlaJ (TadC family)
VSNEIDNEMLAQATSAMVAGDEVFLSFLRTLSYSSMSLGLTLALADLKMQDFGSMEGVIAHLTRHRDMWRDASEEEAIYGQD